MFIMKDYLDSFHVHDAEMERKRDSWLKERPICECCGEPIEEEHAYVVEDLFFCDKTECEEAANEAILEIHKSDYRQRIA